MSVAISAGVGAVIAGGVAAAGTVASGIMASNAAGDRLTAEQQALQLQIQERAKTIASARDQAQLQPGEIASINKLLSTQGEQLTRTFDSISKQQSILDKMDPSVKAASQELIGLLHGEAAKTLAPVMAMQDRQRNDLKMKLANQMGAGWQTSSAGMEAMARFDAQSALAVSQMQQTALTQAASIFGGLTSTQMQGQAGVTAATANAFSNSADIDKTILSANQNVANRKVNAELGAVNAAPVNFGAPAQVAGGANAAMGNTFSNLANAGAGVAGTIMGQQNQMNLINTFADKMSQNQFSAGMSPFVKDTSSNNNNMFAIG